MKNPDNLTDYAVEILYPEKWMEPTIEESEEAFQLAQKS